MSIMIWHVLRRLPRPALLGLLIFLLTAMARASSSQSIRELHPSAIYASDRLTEGQFRPAPSRKRSSLQVPSVTRSYTPFW